MQSNRPLRVYVLDLLSTVPYYDAYFCSALSAAGDKVQLGAITYHLDTSLFRDHGLRKGAGILNVIGRFRLPAALRRPLKVIEAMLNMAWLLLWLPLTRPDVVHIQYLPLLQWKMPFEIWFVRALRRLKLTVIYTVHDLLPHNSGVGYQRQYEALYNAVDALICHSEPVRKHLIEDFSVEPERITVIEHGPLLYKQKTADERGIRSRYSIPAEVILVLFQGKISRYKGLTFLLSSWQEVAKVTGTQAHLLIAGSGEAEFTGELEHLRDTYRLQDTVHFDWRFLPTEDVASLYSSADIAVYPYREITTSGALMTGLALGKAIIATSIPVFQDALRNGELGTLVEYGDVDGFSKALLMLIQNDDKRKALADAVCRLHLGDSTWSGIARKTHALYAARLNAESRYTAHLIEQ